MSERDYTLPCELSIVGKKSRIRKAAPEVLCRSVASVHTARNRSETFPVSGKPPEKQPKAMFYAFRGEIFRVNYCAAEN